MRGRRVNKCHRDLSYSVASGYCVAGGEQSLPPWQEEECHSVWESHSLSLQLETQTQPSVSPPR